eukprot:1140562-Pelagomonas_calceolata.AAC.2
MQFIGSFTVLSLIVGVSINKVRQQYCSCKGLGCCAIEGKKVDACSCIPRFGAQANRVAPSAVCLGTNP